MALESKYLEEQLKVKQLEIELGKLKSTLNESEKPGSTPTKNNSIKTDTVSVKAGISGLIYLVPGSVVKGTRAADKLDHPWIPV